MTSTNITGIYFYPDNTKNNYFAYLDNVYFANVKASYPYVTKRRRGEKEEGREGSEEGREERDKRKEREPYTKII